MNAIQSVCLNIVVVTGTLLFVSCCIAIAVEFVGEVYSSWKGGQ